MAFILLVLKISLDQKVWWKFWFLEGRWKMLETFSPSPKAERLKLKIKAWDVFWKMIWICQLPFLVVQCLLVERRGLLVTGKSWDLLGMLILNLKHKKHALCDAWTEPWVCYPPTIMEVENYPNFQGNSSLGHPIFHWTMIVELLMVPKSC